MLGIDGPLLVVEEDSRSLAQQRARAEALLDRCMAICQPRVDGQRPRVRLVLVDNPDSSQVSIGMSALIQTPLGNAPPPIAWLMEGEAVFLVETTPRWLEEASDEQLLAVFAHELGHVVQGDCGPVEKTWWQRVSALSLPLTVATVFAVFMLLATGLIPVGERLRYLSIALVPFCWWVGAGVWWCHRRRMGEYQADAFAARHGFGEALLLDLERTWGELDRLERWWAYGPTATHPPYPRRKRALARLR